LRAVGVDIGRILAVLPPSVRQGLRLLTVKAGWMTVCEGHAAVDVSPVLLSGPQFSLAVVARSLGVVTCRGETCG
jgi:hypothetical protein